MPHEKSCGIVLFNEEGSQRKYLILHYEEGHWDFPKGHVETNESEVETAKRETAEETGITDVEIIPDFRESIEYFYKREGKTFHKVVYFYLGRTATAAFRLSNEHVDARWLSFGDGMEKLTFQNAKEILSKAEEFLHRKTKQ